MTSTRSTDSTCGMCAGVARVVCHIYNPARRWEPYDAALHDPRDGQPAEFLIEPCPTCWPGGQR